MSERVEFEVKATPNRFAAYDYHVAQKGFCRNSIEAKKLAATLNAREEELERLKAENAELRALLFADHIDLGFMLDR